MDMSSLFNFSASGGPPARKGDAGTGSKGLVEGMKVGLKAHYAKTGELAEKTGDSKASQQVSRVPVEVQQAKEVAPSVMRDALKTGLRAWYSKNGGLPESTTQVNVGASLPERALGGWKEGKPSRRFATPMKKGGSSLRDDIQALERKLEATLATLSNKHPALSENELFKFRNQLADALNDMLVRGDSGKMHGIKKQATLIESSKFIGDQQPETQEMLTSGNDLGVVFSKMMGDYSGPIVEMVSNQLSSGLPLHTIRSNVAAALQNTTTARVRNTLSKAARVLSAL